MSKKELSVEEIYKRNQKRAKVCKTLAPIVFWGFLALAIICLIFALKNSFGNIAEIMDLLDTKKYTGEELKANYDLLIDKYGEWIIGTGGSGFTITFIHIGHALFSGLAVTNAICSVIFLVSAYVIGKWFLPRLSTQILTNNQDMVNLTILQGSKKE